MTKISVVMAVYEPDLDYLEEQIASLAAQDFKDWSLIAVIADKMSELETRNLAAQYSVLIDVVVPDTILNPVDAFEVGLQFALKTDATHIALCDQDDVWRPDRLSCGLKHLADKQNALCHSDARVVDYDGLVRHTSLFRHERRLRNPSVQDLLYRNTVTGMTVLATRSIIETALPFPKQDGVHFFHDLWLALVARSVGQLIFVDDVLVDYRQHANNAVGTIRAPAHKPIRARVAEHALIRYLSTSLQHRTSSKKRSQASATAALSHLLDAARFAFIGHFSLAATASSCAAIVAGRPIWALRRALFPGWKEALQTFDTKCFSASPGYLPPASVTQAAVSKPKNRSWWTYLDGRMDLKFVPTNTRPVSNFVVLIPTLNPSEAFAGVATAIDLGLGLLGHGHDVTFIATDLPISDERTTRMFLKSRTRKTGVQGKLDIQCGVTSKTIAFNKADNIVATAWWTAHLAAKIQDDVGIRNPFHYLIQDYEPCFYPWGTEYAYARSSYDLPHVPIYNSKPLMDYFIQQKIGIHTGTALHFRPSIDLKTYTQNRPPASGPRTLAIYGRPEVARNLFPLTIAALGNWLEKSGLTREDVTIVSVGLLHDAVELPGGITAKSLGKLPWSDYPNFLRTVDVGLSLMCSPHPSHPPIEMAAAGAQVVTNDFATKSMGPLSGNIHPSDLSIGGLVAALEAAWDQSSEASSRVDMSGLGPHFDDMIAQLNHSFQTSLVAA